MIEEGLKWLMEKGFRIIVDFRVEIVKDNFYLVVLEVVLEFGKVELFKFLVDIGTVFLVE